MRVVSDEVGLNQMFRHDAGLVPFHASGDENILVMAVKSVRRKYGHGYLLYVF